MLLRRSARGAAGGILLAVNETIRVLYVEDDERLARLIVHLAEDEAIEDTAGLLVPLQISRAQLALLLGCRSETLIRTLHSAEFECVIDIQREGIRILNFERLRAMAA